MTKVIEIEKRISDTENKILENNEDEERERKILNHEYRLKELNDSKKSNNIWIIGIPKKRAEWILQSQA